MPGTLEDILSVLRDILVQLALIRQDFSKFKGVVVADLTQLQASAQGIAASGSSLASGLQQLAVGIADVDKGISDVHDEVARLISRLGAAGLSPEQQVILDNSVAQIDSVKADLDARIQDVANAATNLASESAILSSDVASEPART